MEVQVEAQTVGRFSNQVMIGHDPESFELRFLYIPPGSPRGLLVAHIILTPPHAKRLLKALEENIRRYEATFGSIPEQVLPIGPVQ
ncbi:MAG: DUF3467 domain-containing protein [Acidobacteria bacterium]|nr:DUF3467 domain-containing protein [Acidobacteriota bacterium]